MPSPNRGLATSYNTLNEVSCTSARACMAVGYYMVNPPYSPFRTLAESWNGTAWSLTPSKNKGTGPYGIELSGVSCRSATWCIAVGAYDTTKADRALAEFWDGTAWTVMSTPNAGRPSNSNFLSGVSCLSARACVAVGWYDTRTEHTLAEAWNGTTWSVIPTPDTRAEVLTAVSCASARACTAVGYRIGPRWKTLAEHWNGATWSVLPTPDLGSSVVEAVFAGVSCATADACVAVGRYSFRDSYKPLAESLHGGKWSIIPVPRSGPEGRGVGLLNGVSCTSADACTVAGAYPSHIGGDRTVIKTLAEFWNGTSWRVLATPNAGSHANGFNAVSCVSADTCTAVGSYQGDHVDRTLTESSW